MFITFLIKQNNEISNAVRDKIFQVVFINETNFNKNNTHSTESPNIFPTSAKIKLTATRTSLATWSWKRPTPSR